MADTGNQLGSLRPNRYQYERVMLALAISLFAHVLIFSGYVLSREIPSLRRIIWVAANSRPVPVQRNEEPIEFATVDNPSTEMPKNAKYYSNKNSLAANPDANQDTDQPKLNGKQTDAPDTRDVSDYRPSKSTTGADQREVDASMQQPGPKPSESAGDLTLGKPDQMPQQQPRPRTLKQAYQEMANRVPSMTMKEEGGVRRHDKISSLDIQLTGFGDYDAQFFGAVRDNWMNELESQKFADDRIGKVVLIFNLNSNGQITEMRVAQTNVGELLAYVCEKAVLEGAPYAPWTEEMRLKLGESRQLTLIFDYLNDE